MNAGTGTPAGPGGIDALLALVGTLTPATLLAQARSLEDARDPLREAQLRRHFGFARDDLMVTPYMLGACEAGRVHGRFAFDRLERHFPPPAPDWLGPEHAGLDFAVELDVDRVRAPRYWPFAQDAPVADFELTTSPKWLGHSVVHALIGFGWWPGLTAWDVLHAARLSEGIAAWWWYWPAELGRGACPRHGVWSADWSASDCSTCALVLASVQLRDSRLARLAAPEVPAQQQDGLAFLRQEVAAFAAGVRERRLDIPDSPVLTVGEACEYARVNTLRMQSVAFQRWLEALLIPGVDYARDHDELATRASQVLTTLLGLPGAPPPRPPARDEDALRALRVAQDVGYRLCHAAALAGASATGYQVGLTALADAARALHAGAPAQHLAAALDAAYHDYAAAPAPTLAPAQLFALGYHPGDGVEPGPLRAARRAAYQQRLDSSGSLARVLARAWPAGADAVVAGHARRPELVADLVGSAVDSGLGSRGLDAAGVAFLHWFTELAAQAGPTRVVIESLWFYRFCLPSLPAKARWHETSLRLNPYLQLVESPYDTGWLSSLLAPLPDAASASAPAPASAPELRVWPAASPGYLALGPGRRHPLLLVITAERAQLLGLLSEARGVSDLVGAGVPPEVLADAVACQLVIAVSGGA
ncbi:MAG: hypothetical protein IT370_00665 [Deltaproteobacteria bacterium]|nr:hypothetical protein [Deltaproteobacteria bacterium]